MIWYSFLAWESNLFFTVLVSCSARLCFILRGTATVELRELSLPSFSRTCVLRCVLYSRTEVRCVNFSSGCPWRGELSDAYSHEAVCAGRPQHCEVKGLIGRGGGTRTLGLAMSNTVEWDMLWSMINREETYCSSTVRPLRGSGRTATQGQPVGRD